MRAFQALMGDIQDSEVLLAALADAGEEEQVSPKIASQLRARLRQRRRELIDGLGCHAG